MVETKTPEIDFFDATEKYEPPKSSGINFKNNFSKLIFDENDTKHFIFLTDFLRTIKIPSHWNDEDKKFDLCDALYKQPCKRCKPSKEDKKKGNSYPSITRWALGVCLEKVGSKRTKDDGTEYEEDAVVFAELRGGEASINFETLLNENNTNMDDKDPHAFYEAKEGVWHLEKSRLINCGLMYDEKGQDLVWQLRKTTKKNDKGSKKVSYPEPKYITHEKVKKNLGPQALLRVPKVVREWADNLTSKDILPFVLVHYGNVKWDVFGIQPPKEGDKPDFNSAFPKVQVDADKVL